MCSVAQRTGQERCRRVDGNENRREAQHEGFGEAMISVLIELASGGGGKIIEMMANVAACLQ